MHRLLKTAVQHAHAEYFMKAYKLRGWGKKAAIEDIKLKAAMRQMGHDPSERDQRWVSQNAMLDWRHQPKDSPERAAWQARSRRDTFREEYAADRYAQKAHRKIRNALANGGADDAVNAMRAMSGQRPLADGAKSLLAAQIRSRAKKT